MKQATWSKDIHTAEFLYNHRQWRFKDFNLPVIFKGLSLKAKPKILEVACGPGALCAKIKQIIPSAEILGFDNDKTFIDYAMCHVPTCKFLVADANWFIEPPFDIVISHTIMEYMPQDIFFPCITRNLKDNGYAIILSVLPGCHRNKMIWEPHIPIIEKAISKEKKCVDISKLCIPQGYNDTNIISTLFDNGLSVLSIDYIPLITSLDDLRESELNTYINIAYLYQLSRIKTQSKMTDSEYQSLTPIIREYFCNLKNQVKNIRPTDIELIRIIRAKKVSAHSYC